MTVFVGEDCLFLLSLPYGAMQGKNNFCWTLCHVGRHGNSETEMLNKAYSSLKFSN